MASIAYEKFKKSPRLKKVTKHNILVGKITEPAKEEKPLKKGTLHTIVRAVFSTLSSGDLTVRLNPKSIQLSIELDKDIKELTINEENPEKILKNLPLLTTDQHLAKKKVL